MNAFARRHRAALLVSTFVAIATVAAIAGSDSPTELWHVLVNPQPLWLLAAFGAELLAYAGYVLAYRATVTGPGQGRLPLMLAVRLVVAGFGPFIALGGFAFDRIALRSVHHSVRTARTGVVGLGVVEYALLAPAACACAAIMYAQSRSASPLITLPWILAVPPGFLLAWWATRPQLLEYFSRSGGRLRSWVADVLGGVEVLRKVVLHPLERPDALLGMALYWFAEIACFYFAMRCFQISISVPATVVAYATGYAASRRSLPLGGAGITEALLTISLIAVHVDAAHALVAVVAYRLVNFLAPMLPSLFAHASLAPLLEGRERSG